jgi:putative DNA primase/helicase
MAESRIDLALLRARLAARAAELAIALLGEPNRAMSHKRELRFGHHGSIAVVVAGPKAGLWFDHETRDGGDVIKLIMRERGGSFLDAVRFAEQFVGQLPFNAAPTNRAAMRVPAADSVANMDAALRIWNEAIPFAGTIAEHYLASRSIRDLAPGIDGEALRFHPRCPWRNDAGDMIKVPALIGLFRDIHTDVPRAIHRRALTNDGQKIGKPKALGPKTNCAIKLSPNVQVSDRLTIGEGVETTLAGMMLGYFPAWAVGDAGELARFPVLDGVDPLNVLVDNDIGIAGQNAALRCSARWTGAQRTVFRIIPRQSGTDINDLVDGRIDGNRVVGIGQARARRSAGSKIA